MAGFSGNQVDGDNYAGYTKAGLYAGALVGRRLNEDFTLNFGMAFIQKGARKNANPKAFDYDWYRLSINYIDIPVQLTRTFKKFNVFIGATYSQLINYKETYTFGNANNYDNRIHKFDVGWMFGGEKKFNNNYSVGFRFNYSLIPMRDFFYSPAQPALVYNNIWGRWFHRGFYNNVLLFYISKEITPKKKSEE
jgi:hypothetical protein